MSILVTGGAGFIGSNFILHRFFEVGDHVVNAAGGKDSLNQVGRTVDGITRQGGIALLAPHRPMQAHIPHESLHRAAGHLDLLSNQLTPHLVRTINMKISIPQPANLRPQIRISFDALGQSLGISLAGLVLVVGRRSTRQYSADRLGPVKMTVEVDEGGHHLRRRSSSAWAKKADALRSISLARRSSRFSAQAV